MKWFIQRVVCLMIVTFENVMASEAYNCLLFIVTVLSVWSDFENSGILLCWLIVLWLMIVIVRMLWPVMAYNCLLWSVMKWFWECSGQWVMILSVVVWLIDDYDCQNVMASEAYNFVIRWFFFSASFWIDDRTCERGKYLPVSYEVIPTTSSLIGDRHYLNAMLSETCDLPVLFWSDIGFMIMTVLWPVWHTIFPAFSGSDCQDALDAVWSEIRFLMARRVTPSSDCLLEDLECYYRCGVLRPLVCSLW